MFSSLRRASCNVAMNAKSTHWWTNVKMAPPDPILGVTDAFKRDKNPNKINLGVGAYRDDNGKPYVLECVKKAEKQLADQNLDKEYTQITGVSDFCEAAVRLLLGDDSPAIQNKLYGVAQTISGTGGLRVGFEFLVCLLLFFRFFSGSSLKTFYILFDFSVSIRLMLKLFGCQLQHGEIMVPLPSKINYGIII